MTQPVRKAVIAVAGYGTRFLPTTKAIPKEMLPIINKPTVQYIVEELVGSGIEEIIFVTNWQKGAIQAHFEPSHELEHQLISQGKENLVKDMQPISSLAKFVYVNQIEGYGNALPVITAKDLLGDEPFIYAFADDLVKSTVPFSQQLINTYQQSGCSVIGVQEVDSKDVSKYGIVEIQGELVTNIIEKPTVADAPSNLAFFGRALFTADIFDALTHIGKSRDNEYWVTDAIKLLAKQGKVVAQPVQGGQWLTTGDPANYLNAYLEYAKDDPALRAVIAKHANELASETT